MLIARRAAGIVRQRPLLAIWLTAVAIRALFVGLLARSPFVIPDSAEYDAIGRALLEGRWLSESHFGGGRPPVYPLFVGAAYAVGGTAALQVAQVLVGATTVVLIAALARTLLGPSAQFYAGILGAFYPWFIFHVGGLASETIFTFVAVATMLAILAARQRGGLGWVLGAGFLFGLAALTRSNILVLSPFLFVWWWRWYRLFAALTFTVGVVLALSPFTAYNAAQGNGFVVGSSGGGLLFYIGNNPDQTLLYSGRLSDEEWRELSNKTIGPGGMAFLRCSELPCVPLGSRDRFFYEAGLRYITTFPGEWAITVARKVMHGWQPWVDPRAYPLPVVVISGVSFTALFVLALLGIRRMDRVHIEFYVAVALGTTLTAGLFAAYLRYRFPILDPLLIAAASQPISRWAGIARERVPLFSPSWIDLSPRSAPKRKMKLSSGLPPNPPQPDDMTDSD